jgi:molybdate transport system ATP-binding protein
MSLAVALRHRFPATEIDIAFTAPEAGVTALFGPSGAGKSTVLAAVAGLLRPDRCRVVLGETVLADTADGLWLPAERRGVGLVFQDARLFPHLSVAGNLRYGLRRARSGRGIGFDDVVALLALAPLLARRPHTLSGGERQRVGIGRALLAQPRLLLLDEPLASLDAVRRDEILPFLGRLKSALHLPMLYVTHAFDEAARLADYLVLLEAGHMLAAGALDAVSARADLPLARRDDAGAVLLCHVAGQEPARRLMRLECNALSLLVPARPLPAGTALRVRIPAREVILARADAQNLAEALSLHNIVPGTVRALAEDKERNAVLVEIDSSGVGLLSRITADAVSRLALASGAPVLALVKSMSVDVLGG